jgi:ABC-type Na+ efflux pump permease subunit
MVSVDDYVTGKILAYTRLALYSLKFVDIHC